MSKITDDIFKEHYKKILIVLDYDDYSPVFENNRVYEDYMKFSADADGMLSIKGLKDSAQLLPTEFCKNMAVDGNEIICTETGRYCVGIKIDISHEAEKESYFIIGMSIFEDVRKKKHIKIICVRKS